MNTNKNIIKSSDLVVLLESCSKSQLLAIIAEMIESEQIDYQEMSKEDLIQFITENFNNALMTERYNNENESVDLCFKIALEVKTTEMSERFNKQQRANEKDAIRACKPYIYYCCLVYTISYFVKDIRILDDIDGFIAFCTGYVNVYQLTTIANRFNLAIRVRRIPDGRDKVEYINKASN